MLDQLRRDIKTRLDELLGEAHKLRQALAALSSRDSSPGRSVRADSSPARPRRRADSAPASASTTRRSASSRPKGTARASARASASPRAPKPPATKRASGSGRSAARTAPGATKSAILAVLANGNAMTAGEIATATGLGRPTVSTTLSRLAKTGELTKATRGYQVSTQTPASAAAGADDRARTTT